MRTLKFIIDGQTITLDPNCNVANLVPGSSGYLKAEFSFSPEWSNTTRVVAFFSNLGKEYPPQVLKADRTCNIPVEALAKSIFKVQVIGKKNNLVLRTNKAIVYQKGGKV